MNEDAAITGYVEYANHTMVSLLGLMIVVTLAVFLLLLPRRWSVLPVIVLACFVSSAQRIVIFGMDFDFLRLMVLVGFLRISLRKDNRGFTWKTLDAAIILWAFAETVIYTIQWGTLSVFINRMGASFDTLGMYFLFRCLIRDYQDVDRIIFGFILISIPVSVVFIIEHATGRNMFAIFGGVPFITVVREGRLRCQGAYSHAILAGCFWASAIPLFAAYWWKKGRSRFLSVTGCIAASIIVFTCASSTPVLGLLAAVIGGGMFWLRSYMRTVRWCVAFTLICLHMVMNQPVWHLVCRLSAVGGSTGWHRFVLIDETIKHFDQWWLLGIKDVQHWGVWAGDVTNQYILEGVRGGLVSMCLFVIVIAISFREVGKLWRLQPPKTFQLAVSWALGVSVFVHCMNFLGVAYFGQIFVVWYLLLAIIGSLSPARISNTPETGRPAFSDRQRGISR